MPQHYESPMWVYLLRRAEAIGEPFRTQEMVDYMAEHYPRFKTGSVRTQLQNLSINIDERRHPSMDTGFVERTAERRQLFRIEEGLFEPYDAVTHGNTVGGRLE